MDRSKNKCESERKDSKERGSKTAAHNTGDATEVDFDQMAVTENNQRFTEEIKKLGPSSQTLLEGTPAREAGNSFEDIGDDGSHIKESDIIDKECNEMLDALIKVAVRKKSMPEVNLKIKKNDESCKPHEASWNSEEECHRDLCEYKVLNCPNLLESLDNYIRVTEQEKYYKHLMNILHQEKLILLLSAEAKMEILKDLARIDLLEKYPDGQVPTANFIVENEVDKIVTYLLKKKKTVQTYHGGKSNDNIKNTTYTTQKSTKNICEKESVGDISEDKSPSNIKLENDVTKMMKTNKLVNVCNKQKKYEEILSQKLTYLIKGFLQDPDKFRRLRPKLKELKDDVVFLLELEKAMTESDQDSNPLKELANELRLSRIVRNTESLLENYFKTGCNGKAIKEVMSPQLEDSKETIVEMNKHNIINFKFDTCRNRVISTPEREFHFSKHAEQPLTFRFRDEDIQVCFSGENIFVSTKNTVPYLHSKSYP